jgi:hypothetical protein
MLYKACISFTGFLLSIKNGERIMDEPTRQKGQKQPASNSQQTDMPSKPPIVRPDHAADISGDHSNNAPAENNPTPKHWYTGISIADWIMAIATIAIAFSTGVYTHYSKKQWAAMDSQAKIMQGQLSTAKVAFADAQKSGIEQSDRAERLTKANEKIAQASKQSVDTARQVAIKSLDTTIGNFHLEQRAWIGTTTYSPPMYSDGSKSVYAKEGQELKVTITIANTGKTVARKVNHDVSMYLLSPGEDYISKYEEGVQISNPQHSTTVLQPGGTTNLETPLFTTVTKVNIDNIVSGKTILYIAGKITYDDIFNGQHSTKFCLRLKPDLTGFSHCSTYNEAD